MALQFIKKLNIVFFCKLLLFLFFCSGCSTASESFENNPPSYQKELDANGNTVYKSQRIINRSQQSNTFFSDHSNPSSPAEDIGSAIHFISALTNAFMKTDSSTSIANRDHGSTASGESITSLQPIEDDNSYFSVSAGLAAQEQTFSMDLSAEIQGQFLSGALGIAMLGSDKSYYGFTGLLRVHGPWTVSPYLGVGFYAGDSKTCSYKPIGYGYEEESCEKYFLNSAVADLGLRWKANSRIITHLFARQFTQTRQQDPLGKTLYGANIVLLF